MGVVSYDVQATSRRLETAFPLHTEAGVRSFLEKIHSLEELKYYSGDYDVVVWLVDFYEALDKVGLSKAERRTIHYLYFEGYSQKQLSDLLNQSKSTTHTLLTRGIKKIAAHYAFIEAAERGHFDAIS